MDNKLRCFANDVKLVILAIFSALLIYPIVLLIFIPISVYRVVIYYFVKKWDPKVQQMLSGLSAVMVSGNPYTKPEFVLMAAIPLKSKVDRTQVIDVINKQILSSNQFPELSQRIVKKLGYNFWCQTDRTMTAEDYVHYLNPKCPDEPITRSQILGLEAQKVARQPFPSDRSPWDITLVPYFYDEVDPSNKSLAIIRSHHCLMDGLSVRNFMKQAAVKPWKKSKTISNPKTSSWKYLKHLVLLFVTGPYHTIRQAFFNNDSSEFMKMVLLNQQKNDDRPFLKCKDPRPRISINRLKDIKAKHNANVSSTLITLAMGATVQFIKKRWGKVEKKMYLQVAYPIPGHPGKPANHWTTIRMPIHFQENDPVKTLRRNTEEIDKIDNSVIPTLNFCLSKLMGLLPVCLIPKSEDISRQVIVLTNIPGAVGKEDIFGYVYDDMAIHTVVRNGTAILFGCVSAGGKIGIHVCGDPDVFKTDQDISDMNENLENILKALETPSC